MLSLLIFLPAAVAAVLLLARVPDRVALWAWLVTGLVTVGLSVGMWAAYLHGHGPGQFGFAEQVPWMPGIGSSYHVGVDGLSLPLLALTAVIFTATAVYSLRERQQPRSYAALFLALQTTSLGVFSALDLIVFFVFFDLSIVGMYFVIAGWGHGPARRRSALLFFLYTFTGSLALLLGFIGLYVASDPHTFDIAELAAHPPLTGSGAAGPLVLAAIALGLAIKTPTVPFHSWLPPAHTDAPAAGSAVLAGILLKMGTFGFVRIAMPLLPEQWRTYAWVFVGVGVASVLYGALVALAQDNFKRLIAFTSVNHMGYILLGLGAAGLAGDAHARSVAVTGALVQMVSHGLITAALFLLAGVLLDRGGSYDLTRYGALAGPAPRFAALTTVAAFASLGLPGFSGFIAEFQILAGSLGPATPAAAVAALGIVLTAGLFLWAIHRLFLGTPRTGQVAFADLSARELWAIGPLLALSVLIGVFPQSLLGVVTPAADHLIALVGR
ncbi:NADH-quinone oxidoreductase subunit M [Flexivirga sp. ID2601S]|uniref:NADH-quinone oxidoreductase subunit M n=2 Tax=Flexivirga TaxID=1096776 RepID=A0A839NA25_9MICO|nr:MULTISPECIES: NADH-quinone oxidoreductase subunit M [Flexivirga]MBB2892065.1 NADH-quinone oxidoreductase subunit M [Flexivirga oryzae]NNG40725.1 NADH-quinone oxidoreductase subunit M [Flexivirga aerilata]